MNKLLIILAVIFLPLNAHAQIIHMSDGEFPSNKQTSDQDLKALLNINSFKCDWESGGQSFWIESKQGALDPPRTKSDKPRSDLYFDSVDYASGEAIMSNSIGIKKMVTVEKLAKGILFTQKHMQGKYDFVFIFSHRKGAMSLTDPLTRSAFAFTAIYLGVKNFGYGDFVSFENHGNCYSTNVLADGN